MYSNKSSFKSNVTLREKPTLHFKKFEVSDDEEENSAE